MTIPTWLQRIGARVLPSIFLAPDEPPADGAPVVVNHNHITINFTGPPDDFPAFREQLLNTFEDINRKSPGGAS